MRWARVALVSLAALACAACSAPGADENVDQIEEPLKSACEPANVVLGIDIASYQHPSGAAIDWGTVAANRRFVIIKASESTGYTNSYYDGDSKGARAAGMVVGAYHYLRYGSTGAAQAQHFLSAIGGSVPAGDLPPMLDVEDTNDSATPAQRTAIMKEWIDTIAAATGRKPMIYSGAWYWGPYMGTPAGFSENPLVWAAYLTSGCPQIPNDFPGLAIWQYLGGGGKTPGISGACDQDKFYGTEADLLALAGGGADYAGESLGLDGQSYPIVADGAVTVEVGQTVTGWVKLKNTGKQSWQPGVVFLAPIPRDQPSAFKSPSWQSDHRISSVAADVKPGEVGQFELDLTGSVVGESILELGWVAEAITWFADGPKGGGPDDGYFQVKVNVVPSTQPDAGTGGGGGSGGGKDAGMGGSASGGKGATSAGGGSQKTHVEGDDEGCGCRAVGGSTSSGLSFASLLWLAFAARRRRASPRNSSKYS